MDAQIPARRAMLHSVRSPSRAAPKRHPDLKARWLTPPPPSCNDATSHVNSRFSNSGFDIDFSKGATCLGGRLPGILSLEVACCRAGSIFRKA